LAILIFTVTLFIERPLDFSAFPTVLLASLMLRLSLNVSSTKLIIGSGHTGPGAAGGVIEGFAMFVMGGSVFLGLVVFLVLLIVNFVVITKGAGRMAEVGARFALDAMPGKQLAIDSDVAAGAISHNEAKERRRIEQEETTFFGSLDGASKFVKGDAIAGLLITLLNIIAGLGIGLGVHGMSFSAAIETYAVLTVGDGLVSQIPSVITSIAAALLLSKGGVSGSTDRALVDQLGGYPGALGTVAGLMALFALFPGLPFLPFILGAAALALAAVLSTRAASERAETAFEQVDDLSDADTAPRGSIGDLLDVDEIHVRFAPDLIASVLDPAVGLEKRIVNMRRHIATEFGIVMPEVRLTDDPLVAAGHYAIHVQGIEVAQAVLLPGHVLVLTREDVPLELPGDDVAEPVYGAPARWVRQESQEDAAALGLPVIAPGEVIATHLLETVKLNFGRLFTRRALRSLLQEFTRPSDPARAEANRKLLDEFVPEKVPHELLQTVLRLLLEERVSVRNLPLVLEATAEGRGAGLTPEQIVEHVRRRIAFHIVAKLCDPEGKLALVQLAPRWEALFAEHECDDDGRPDIVLPPDEFNRLARAVGDSLATVARQGIYPVVATSARRRRFVRHVLEAKGIQNPVLSFEEIGNRTTLSLVGTA
jgi:flagellar biosynthesis protein FlhA